MKASEMDPGTLRALADEMEARRHEYERRSRGTKGSDATSFFAGMACEAGKLCSLFRGRATRAERSGREWRWQMTIST